MSIHDFIDPDGPEVPADRPVPEDLWPPRRWPIGQIPVITPSDNPNWPQIIPGI